LCPVFFVAYIKKPKNLKKSKAYSFFSIVGTAAGFSECVIRSGEGGFGSSSSSSSSRLGVGVHRTLLIADNLASVILALRATYSVTIVFDI